jgi:hypothetical protein
MYPIQAIDVQEYQHRKHVCVFLLVAALLGHGMTLPLPDNDI